MLNRNINLNDMVNLCQIFDVKFSMEPNPLEPSYVVLILGPVRWSVFAFKEITWSDYNSISMHLAARFPEKILGEKL